MYGGLFIFLISLLCLVTPSQGNEVVPTSYSFTPVGIHQGTWLYDDPTFNKLTDGVYGSDLWASDYAGHDPGTYNGGPWVGWWGITWDGQGYDKSNYNPVEIRLDFNFPSGTQVTGVTIGTNQDARYNWNVVLQASMEISANNGFKATMQIPFSLTNSGDDQGSGFNVGKRHNLNVMFPAMTVDTITLVLSNASHFNGLEWDNLEGLYKKDGIRWDNHYGSQYNGMFWIFLDEVDFYGQVTPIPVPPTYLLLATGLMALIWRRWESK